MKLQKFSCLFGSVAALFVLSNAVLAGEALAQSTAAATAVSLPSGTGAAPFLVAPSFALASAPSSVAMGDLNQDGKPDLVTTDAVTGKVTVFLGTGNGKFGSGVEYATGSHPGAVAVADLNGDGHPEVIVGDESKGTISVLASNGNGTLQLKQTLAAGLDPAFIAVGDFNGDGKVDLAVAARSAASLAILLNDGKGSLQAPALSVLHKAPTSLITADLNNDGHADLALANADGTVSILLGAGNGTFRSLADIAVASGSLSSIVAGDFDRDGNLDLAVTQSGGKALTVLLGKGNGGFASPANYTVGNNPVSALVTDLDGDGIPDLVVINQGSNTYSVLGGNGDGTFRSSLDYVVGNGPVAAVAGEFDANGHVDLAVINPSSQSVTVPLGNGDGTFKAARSYLAGVEPRAVASADLNGDKLQDLVVTNYCGSDSNCGKGGTVAVFLANADGSYRLSNAYAVGSGPVSVALADVNGDKFPDIVALNRGDKTVSVLLAKGDGGFEQPYTFSVTDAPIAVAVGDFNKDGKIDLAVLGDCGAQACSRPGSVEILTGNGDGSFNSALSYATGYSPVSIAAGDLNQDKNLDIVVANRCGTDASCKSPGTATVLVGGAAGKFTLAKDILLGNSPASIALGDMSGRGVPDLLVSSSTNNTLAILHGNGDGSFQTPVAYKIGNAPGSVAVADFDGDGKLDVAVANVHDSTVSVLFGKGDGTLNSSFTVPVGTGPAALTAVAGTNGTRASLVTANGNTGSTTPGTDFTVLANIQPEFTPGPGTTTVTIALGTGAPSPSTVDQAVALKVAVAAVSPAGTPTGTVTFLSNGSPIPDCGTAGVVTLDVAGDPALCTTSSLIAGSPDSLTATYSGDTAYNINNLSNTLHQTVNKATPTVTVGFQTGSSSPSNYGNAVTFVATMGGGGPVLPAGGTVIFNDAVPTAATPITCTTPPTLAPGTAANTVIATCTVSSLSVSTLHSINATYTAGTDPNFNTASSTVPLALTVKPAAPSIAVTFKTGSSGSVFGTQVVFLATVTGTSGFTQPTGTVVFNDAAASGNPALTCVGATDLTLTQNGTTNSTATCTIATLSGGSHSITATYVPGADPNYSASGPSPALPDTVTTLATTTALSSSAPGGSNVDDSVTFTATVTSSPVLTPAPTGTVNFTLNSKPLCSATKVGTNWTCATQLLVAPADVIGATYAGDSNYATSVAPNLPQTVSTIAANITMGSAAQTSVVNQAVTLSAKAVPAGVASPAILPSGTITFMQGSTTLCSGTLGGSPATASCSAVFSAIPSTNPATITPVYSTDRNFTVGTVGTATQTINAVNTIAAITSASPTSSNVNASVVFSTTVTPAFFGAPNGSAVPKSGSISIFDPLSPTPGTAICTVNVTNGVASNCSVQFANSGNRNLTAVFTSTDSNFNNSPSSAAFPYLVNSSTTTVSLTSAPTASSVDQSVSFTAVVASSTSGSAIPAGSVTFTDSLPSPGGRTLCTGAAYNLTATGAVPVCTVSLLTPGQHSITATFTSSNASFGSASSSPLIQVVSKGVPTIGLTLSPSPSTVDQPVSFTSSITNAFAATGSTVPSGTVTFSYAPNGTSITLCTGNINAAGTSASCSAAFPAAATSTPYTVTATYSGDGNFTAGTPTTKNQTVNQTTTSVSITPIAAASSVNQPVTLTATVASTVADTGLTLPSGTITFSDTTSAPNLVLCKASVTPATGVASCSGAFGTIGARNFTAVYSGDANFGTSNAAATSPAVTPSPTTMTVASSTPSPSIVNQAVTFATTLTPKFPGASVPMGGTVTLTDSFNSTTTTICTATVTNGIVAPCISTPFTASGNHSITATFTTGDTNFASSPASISFTQMVNASTTKVVLTTTPASSIVNTPVTFNSVVTSSSSGSAIPQGTVAYMDTSTTPATLLCTVTLDPLTSATPGVAPPCLAPIATAATHTIEAVFTSTNSNFSSASSAIVNLTITPTAPTVAFSVVPTSPVTVDQTVNFTATLTQTPAGTANSAGVISFPTGTITFSYILNNVATIVCNTPNNVSTTGTVTSASCPFTFPSAAAASSPYTVTASYSGDKNFATGTQATTTQVVGLTGTSVTFNTPSPGNTSVNQPVTFTASVAKPAGDPGSTLPTGNFTFFDTTATPAVSLCTATIVTPSTGVATCSAPLHSKGTHTITATYDGDTNFSTSSATQTQTVIQTSPVIKVSGPTVPVVATQVVNFIATVSPTVTGASATAPTGTIVFSSSDGAPNSCSPIVTSPGDGTITNSCQFAFKGTTSGAVTVTASFVSADSNFSSGTGTVAQTVQNFTVAFSQPGPVSVIQSYSNSTDPFTKTAISVSSAPLSGFADSLNVTCQVQGSQSNPGTGTPPTCSLVPATVPGSGSSSSALTVAVPANAPIDQYTVTVTGTDAQIPALSQSATLLVNVVAESGKISVAPGSAAVESIQFNTAGTSATTLNSFACGTIVQSPTVGPFTPDQFSCTGPSSSVTITGIATTAAITIGVNGTTTASASQTRGSITLAAFWGVPLMALLVWLGNRKSPRRNFFRFLGMLLLIVGLAHAIGCGGSFTPPPTVTGGPPVGNYLIQVVATDSNGTNHYAVVPLTVN